MTTGTPISPHGICPDPVRAGRPRWWLLLAGMAWLLAVGTGMAVVIDHAAAPGHAGDPPRHWPVASRIEAPYGVPSLVMLAHPRCPCTRAAVDELAHVMAQARGRLRAYVLFVKPVSADDDWDRTDLWQSAATIPGVTVVRDNGGSEARRFGAVTSGQTVLYDAAGRLLFAGGITASRGHAGDNAGRSAIVSLVTGGTARGTTPVFGCSLGVAREL